MEYQEELGLNLYDMDFRDYDPAIGRWTGMDPVIHHSMSPYNAFDNNPVLWADPSGADSVDGVRYEGGAARAFYQSIIGAMDYFGDSAWSITGVENEGEDENISSFSIDPPPGGSTSKYPVTVNADGTINNMFATALGLSRSDGSLLVADTIAGSYLLSGLALLALANFVADQINEHQASILLTFDANWLFSKQDREIQRILSKEGGPSGMTYALTVNQSGNYVDVRGNIVHLNVGDVWKYGQTINGFNRYSVNELRGMIPGGVKQVPLFFGNQIEILTQEKIMIYGHVLATGSLPPGNRIFK